MDIVTSLGSLATFRNILLAVLMLPLLTMVVLLPIYQYLSKNTKEWIAIFGVFGYIANGVLAVESAFRAIGAIIDYLSQKPTVYFNHKTNRMASKYEPFDSDWIVYLIVLVIITILSAVLANYYNPAKYGSGKRNQDSEINSLNL